MGALRLLHLVDVARSYLLPVFAVACATAIRAGLNAWLGEGRYTFGLFYFAIAASAWFGGLRQGLVAIALSAVSTALLLPPVSRLAIASSGDRVEWALFLALSLAVVLFIDSRNREKERARDAQASLRSLVEVAPVGVALFDRQMRYQVVNAALAEMNGIPVSAHIGRSVGEVLPHVEPVVRRHFEEVLRSGRSTPAIEFTAETPARPGVPRIWREAWFPVKDAAGVVVAVGAIVEDITERRQREDAERALSQRKSEFLAILGHELRTPLSALASALAMLDRQELDRDGARALGLARRQVDQIRRLADDLFDVARLTAGRLSIRSEPVRLLAVLCDVIEAVRPDCERKRQKLVIALEALTELTVRGDAERLSQVFYNLLQNASKFSGEEGEIRIAARARGRHAEITVRDDGIGIPADDLPRVFDMWMQAGNGDRTAGLGLGLALVKQLVELHGGTVSAASEGPGRGAEFVVRLPLADDRCAASTAQAAAREPQERCS